MKSKPDHARAERADAPARKAGAAWPIDVKVAAACMVVDQRLGRTRVARELGVPYDTLTAWVRKYRDGGRAALAYLPGGGTGQSRADRTGRARPVGQREASVKGDPRREAVMAAKRAQPQAGSRRIRDVVRRFFGIGTSETTVRRVLQAHHPRSRI